MEHADDLGAGGERGVGDDTHEADPPAPEDEPDALLAEQRAEFKGAADAFGIASRA